MPIDPTKTTGDHAPPTGDFVDHPNAGRDSVQNGYETTDVNTGGIIVFLGGLFGFVLIFFVFCFFMGRVINTGLNKDDGPNDKWHGSGQMFAGKKATGKMNNLESNGAIGQQELATMTHSFVEPQLQTDDGNQATADLHAKEDLLLDHYSSVPGQPIRIPINRAMELIAQRGLPVAAAAAGAQLMAGDAHPVVKGSANQRFRPHRLRAGHDGSTAAEDGLRTGHENRARHQRAPLTQVREKHLFQQDTFRKALAAAALACVFAPVCLKAQVAGYGDKQAGENSGDQLPNVLQKVQVEQHLNRQLPLDAVFTDETGKQVRLGDYFGKRPAVFSLVYYTCPLLCSEELDGMTGALEMVHLTPGKDFDVVIVSIDPSDTPDLAARKKAFYLKRYGRPETAAGWHFLTGQKPQIDAVTDAVGFGYVKVPGPDGTLSQFAHASSLELITTQGRIAQYYLGVEYSPKDVLLGLIEASGNKIGSPVANILTYCYHYDPQTNRHSLIVARVVQVAGMLTMVTLGGFMFVMFRKDIKLGREHPETDHAAFSGDRELSAERRDLRARNRAQNDQAPHDRAPHEQDRRYGDQG